MNSLTSRQRKIVYALAILVLLVPIIFLGAPLSTDVQPGRKTAVTGGFLAKMRHEHELGESTMGDIDPSSAAANLVLLGLRGMAASVLHQNAIGYQDRKDWGKLKSTVETILRLQPHYVEVWKFQGWNLAFNVSREWDRVDDRFYWVKEGLKFLQKGSQRNQTATILFHNVGDFVGRKIGSSDEKKYFRSYFVADPDEEQFDGGADPGINEEGLDNYLVARDWFLRANERDDVYPVKGITREVFRKSPGQAMFDYANAISGEGKFDLTQKAWKDASDYWNNVFGNEIFYGLDDIPFKYNSSQEELEEMARQNGVTLAVQKATWDRRVKMINYSFWQRLSACEQDPNTVAALKSIFSGKKAHGDGDISDHIDKNGDLQISTAQASFEEGMAKMAKMFELHPDTLVHDDKILDAMLAVHYWQDIHKSNGKEPNPDHPLADFVASHRQYQGEVRKMFQQETAN